MGSVVQTELWEIRDIHGFICARVGEGPWWERADTASYDLNYSLVGQSSCRIVLCQHVMCGGN